jgi:hypothetical protein
VNLWYSTDGTKLIAPDENLPDTILNEEIQSETVCRTEPLVNEYETDGFGEFEVPLLYRAAGNITVTAYLVQEGPTKDALDDIVEDTITNPDALENGCLVSSGAVTPTQLLSRLPSGDSTVVALSEVAVDYLTGQATTIASTETPVINNIGVGYDTQRNLLNINFDHHQDFEGQTYVYILATYPRTKLTIPEELENLRSNRFDVRILLKSGQEVSPELLEFLLQFVFKLKAFHSLLRKISYDFVLVEAYNVTDLCFDVPGLQVPPAVVETEEPEPVRGTDPCDPDSSDRNLKQADLDTRDIIFRALSEEHEAWKALDGTHQSNPDTEHYLNLPVTRPDGDQCQFTQVGQDRVLSSPDADFDHNPDERPKLCETAGASQDNCFKGRVKDNLFLSPGQLNCEIVRCKPCVLGYGYGSYWLYPSNVYSVLRDGFGEHQGQNSTSFLGSQIKRYNDPIPKSIHYTANHFLTEDNLESDKYLAYRRPSLEIQKETINFPQHRFVNGGNLYDDFQHPSYRAKPWDGDDLNAELVEGSDGDEYLVYDDTDLVYLANGLESDISSYGAHDDRDYLVTHKIFMVTDEGHPSVTLDESVVISEQESIVLDSSVPFGPIFRSYNSECNQDYRDGYPAEYDDFQFDPEEYGFSREGTDTLGDALGLPTTDSSSAEATFRWGSQIFIGEEDAQYRYVIPYRYDCDCLQFPCDTAATAVTGATEVPAVTAASNIEAVLEDCPTDLFRTPVGTLDFGCDRLNIEISAVLEERVGACSTQFDGTILNHLCTMSNGLIPEDDEISETGSIWYKDQWEVIHEAYWTYQDGYLDIVYITKSPNVWGEEPDGYVQGLAVFRKGIITTTRQLLKETEDGYESQGEASSQVVDYYQSNLVCGDDRFVDNFCYHYECMVTDEADHQVLCGTRWADVDDSQVEWPDLIVDSSGVVVGSEVPSGIQPFAFMGTWDDSTTPAVCGESTGSGATS